MSNRVNGREQRKGKFTRELVGAMVPTKVNQDNRRVNMYAAAIAAGQDIPYHLADRQDELAKFSDELPAEVTVDVEEFDISVLESI